LPSDSSLKVEFDSGEKNKRIPPPPSSSSSSSSSKKTPSGIEIEKTGEYRYTARTIRDR
jgi:hypothetical protein